MKHKKRLFIALATLVVVALFHFVPIYSANGIPNGDTATCTGINTNSDNITAGDKGSNDMYQRDYYRIIPNGTRGFSNEKGTFVRYDNGSCGVPVTLRLYLW